MKAIYRYAPWVVVLFAVLYSIMISGCNGNGPEKLTVSVNVEPVWENAASTVSFATDMESQDFYLFWDRSRPMEGYLHHTNADSQDVFQSIRRSLYSAQNISDYRIGSRKCYGITGAIESVDCNLDLSTLDKAFIGPESRIDKGIEFLTAGLKDGSIVGAALVSDLMTTVGADIGPTSLLKYFKNDPEFTAGFNAGEINIAIVGFRMSYWGVRCEESVNDTLGCWFSEIQQRWVPLERLVKRPIYVLIMGRNLEDHPHDRDNNPVIKIATELVEDIESDTVDVAVEFLTRGVLDRKIQFDWLSPLEGDGPEKIMKIDTIRGYSCQYDGSTKIRGEFQDSLISIHQIGVGENDSLDFFSRYRIENNRTISLMLDCESVRNALSIEKQDIEQDMNCYQGEFESGRNMVTTYLNYDEVGLLSGSLWSSSNETANSTLDMDDFIDGLKPTHYEAIISPAPPLDCQK